MIRPAVRAAMSEVRKVAKANVVQETGLLRQSIGVKIKTYKSVVFGVVGPQTGFTQTVDRTAPSGWRGPVKSNPTNYAHLVEFGTAHSPAHPFMRPAFDNIDLVAVAARKLTAVLDKEAMKK
jgi:HK97 gp10 family phage protein